MLRLLVGMAAILFSCGDSGPDCGFEDGVYTVEYRKLNGDCPNIALSVISPKAYPPECKQTFTYQDNCGVNVVRECESDGLYGRYVLTLEPRGMDYIGLYQVSGPVNRERSCVSVYDVTYRTQ